MCKSCRTWLPFSLHSPHPPQRFTLRFLSLGCDNLGDSKKHVVTNNSSFRKLSIDSAPLAAILMNHAPFLFHVCNLVTSTDKYKPRPRKKKRRLKQISVSVTTGKRSEYSCYYPPAEHQLYNDISMRQLACSQLITAPLHCVQ